MKFLWLITLSTLWGWAQTYTDRYRLGDHNLTVITELYDEYGIKGRAARFYLDDNGTRRRLFSLVLEEKETKCWGADSQVGTFRIKGSTITTFTRWKRGKGSYHAPQGVRKTTYRLDKQHHIKRQSVIYLETDMPGHSLDKGMTYLFMPPKTPKEKKALQDYIREVEDTYKAHFLVEKQQIEALRNEVDRALQNQAIIRWH